MFLVKQLLDVGSAFVMPLPISPGLNAEMRSENVAAHFEPHHTSCTEDERNNADKNSQHGIENFD